MLFKKLGYTNILLVALYLTNGIVNAASFSTELVDTRTEMTATEGQYVVLHCGDELPENNMRYWTMGNKVLSAAYVVITKDDRITVTKGSKELTVANVTSEDEGEYTCTLTGTVEFKYTVNLRVQELICESPTEILHGKIEDATIGKNIINYRYGMVVRYYCDKGYKLIGPSSIVCADPHKGWTEDSPACVDEFAVGLQKRLEDMENEMYRMQQLYESKMAAIDTRFLNVEASSHLSSHNLDLIKGINETLLHLQRDTSDKFQKMSHGDLVASLRVEDGHVIAEFTWFIEDFDEKIAQHRAGKFRKLESRKFYTNIPGYRMQLWVYPDYKNSGYVSINAAVARGAFDNELAWPFAYRYGLSLWTRNNTDFPQAFVTPSKKPCEHAFEKPLKNGTIFSCGRSIVSIENLQAKKKDVYVFNGGIVFRIKIYLSDSG